MANRIIFTCTTVPTGQEYTNWVSANTDTTKNKTYTITDGYQVDLYVNDSVTSITTPIFAGSTIKTIMFNTPNITVLSSDNSTGTLSDGLFYNCTTLHCIQLPKYLQVVGYGCFYGCTSLISAILPDSLLRIRENAFYGCSKLYYVKLPANLTSIGDNAFTELPSTSQIVSEATTPFTLSTNNFKTNGSYANSLYVVDGSLSAYQSDSNWSGVFSTIAVVPSNNRIILYTTQQPYTYSDFNNKFLPQSTISASNLKEQINGTTNYIYVIYVKDTIINLGGDTFNTTHAFSIELDTKNITHIAGIYSAKGGTFSKSDATYIKLPDTITYIGNGAFVNCYLNFLYIPASLNSLESGGSPKNIFYGKITHDTTRKYTINSIVVDNDNVTFNDVNGSNCIVKTSNSTLFCGCANTVISSSISIIDTYAFTDCDNFTSITIPSHLTSWGFSSCTSLTTVILENGLTTTGTFQNCTGLTEITIPNSVTTISNNAFNGCTSLSSITLPDNLITINDNAFSDCTSLSSITIPNSVTTIGSTTFNHCTSLSSITLPNNLQQIPTQICLGCTSLSSITIPNSVTTINSQAFLGCTSLSDFNIPNSVISIKSGAFNNTAWLNSQSDGVVTKDGWIIAIKGNTIESVTISSTKIASGAFNNVTSLKYINISNNITSIEGGMFNGCSNIETVEFEENSSLTTINGAQWQYTFGPSTNITRIDLPSSLTAIKRWAFNGLTNLTTVTCKATTPPSLEANNFTASNDTLYVPSSSKSTYEANTSWRNAFTNIKGIYIVTTSAGQGGTITPTTEVLEGESFTVTATPNEHYKVSHFIVDGVDVGTIDNYTFQNLDADHTVYVEFELITHTITATAFEGGAIIPSGTITVTDGDDVNFDIIPLEGYDILALFIDGTQIDPTPTYTFENVTTDHTIQALFYKLRSNGFNRDEMLDINFILQDYLEQLKKRD